MTLKFIALVIGGFLLIWVLQGVLDWAITRRFIHDPVKSKVASTLCAMLIVLAVPLINPHYQQSAIHIIPATALVALLEIRAALQMRTRSEN